MYKGKERWRESGVQSLIAAVAVFHHGQPTCTGTKRWGRSANCAGRYYTDVCFINAGILFFFLLENVCPYNIQGTVMTVWKRVWPGMDTAGTPVAHVQIPNVDCTFISRSWWVTNTMKSLSVGRVGCSEWEHPYCSVQDTFTGQSDLMTEDDLTSTTV